MSSYMLYYLQTSLFFLLNHVIVYLFVTGCIFRAAEIKATAGKKKPPSHQM